MYNNWVYVIFRSRENVRNAFKDMMSRLFHLSDFRFMYYVYLLGLIRVPTLCRNMVRNDDKNHLVGSLILIRNICLHLRSRYLLFPSRLNSWISVTNFSLVFASCHRQRSTYRLKRFDQRVTGVLRWSDYNLLPSVSRMNDIELLSYTRTRTLYIKDFY